MGLASWLFAAAVVAAALGWSFLSGTCEYDCASGREVSLAVGLVVASTFFPLWVGVTCLFRWRSHGHARWRWRGPAIAAAMVLFTLVVCGGAFGLSRDARIHGDAAWFVFWTAAALGCIALGLGLVHWLGRPSTDTEALSSRG